MRPRGHATAWPDATLAQAASLVEVPGGEGTAVLALHLGGPGAHEEAIGYLLRATIALWPAWLPAAAGIDGTGGAGGAAIRILAARTAGTSDLFGPFLERMALAAASGTAPDISEFVRAVVVRECLKLLRRAYGQGEIAFVLEPAPGVAVEDAALLLADAGFVTVVVGPGAAGLARIPAAVQPFAPTSGAEAAGPPAREIMSSPAGKPNPLSEAECRLEAFLALEGWAAGRAWNQTWTASVLERPVRLDILWERERCVVEIDGPDHLAADKYAADRRRDRLLQHAGYAVLRFTNQEVVSDIERVGREIAGYLDRRRGTDDGA